MYNYTIIIPHYNIPDLLMRCLSSIPVREDIQVIVVDDCSPDADTYREKYPELSRPYLELYSTPQGGSAGRARNVGLQHAKGKWVLFADADDYFNDCLLEVLDEYVHSDLDLIYFYPASIDPKSGKEIERTKYLRKNIIECQNESLDSIRYRFPVPWCKIIRHSIIQDNSISFQEIRYGNDVLFSTKVGYFANGLHIDKREIYTVTSRQDRIGKNRSKDAISNRFTSQLAKYKFLKDHGVMIDNPIKTFCLINSIELSRYWDFRIIALEYGVSTTTFTRLFFEYYLSNLFSPVITFYKRICRRIRNCCRMIIK